MKQVFLALILLACSSAHAMGIEQAYQLIPHQRTVFQLHKTNLPASEAQQVARLLKLSEKAMVERVNALKNGASKTDYMSRIDSILWQIEQLQVPGQVKAARDHIQIAVQQHRSFFELQNDSGSNAKASRNQLIQSSHQHLISAYGVLMRSYPEEVKHNKQAFFDYLCALDFI
jgi:hypothetical protein